MIMKVGDVGELDACGVNRPSRGAAMTDSSWKGVETYSNVVTSWRQGFRHLRPWHDRGHHHANLDTIIHSGLVAAGPPDRWCAVDGRRRAHTARSACST